MSDKCAECGYSEHFHGEQGLDSCSGFKAAKKRRSPWVLAWTLLIDEDLMDLGMALRVVLDLARENALGPDEFLDWKFSEHAEDGPMNQLVREAREQRDALDSVEDFLKHNFGEEE